MLSWNPVEREQTVLRLQYGLLLVHIYDIHIHYYNSSQCLHRASYLLGAALRNFSALIHLNLTNKL